MKFFDVRQGSPEWHELRQGRPTASCFDRILTPKTRKPSAQQEDYIDELIADMMRLSPPDGSENYVNRAMQHGIDCEPEARRFYEMERRCTVTNGGFCMDDAGRFGCSPDGLIGEEGCLELKCPMGKTQVGYLRSGLLPSEYTWQVHGHLIVTGRAWCDFLSYAVGLPPLLIRVEPNDDTEALRKALDAFWDRYMTALAFIGDRAGLQVRTKPAEKSLPEAV